jgi:putative heme iron utilization protein
VYEDAVQALLAGQRSGVLSTLSARLDGWPFGSVVLYALNAEGEPLVQLSQLAEHTRNLAVDNRASLFVQAAGEDPQASGRATLLGRVERSDDPAHRAQYVARHPQTESYFGMSDFAVFVLRVEHVRYVGGFSEMGWVKTSKS